MHFCHRRKCETKSRKHKHRNVHKMVIKADFYRFKCKKSERTITMIKEFSVNVHTQQLVKCVILGCSE